MSGNKKVVSGVKNHTEQPPSQAQLKSFKEKAAKGKSPQQIEDKGYLYSTVDYPIPVTYTNGEQFIVAPKGKELVDKALLDENALPKGLILKPV